MPASEYSFHDILPFLNRQYQRPSLKSLLSTPNTSSLYHSSNKCYVNRENHPSRCNLESDKQQRLCICTISQFTVFIFSFSSFFFFLFYSLHSNFHFFNFKFDCFYHQSRLFLIFNLLFPLLFPQSSLFTISLFIFTIFPLPSPLLFVKNNNSSKSTHLYPFLPSLRFLLLFSLFPASSSSSTPRILL